MNKQAIITVNKKEYVMKFEGNIDMGRIDEEMQKTIKDIINDNQNTVVEEIFKNIKFIFDVRCKIHYDLMKNNKSISIIEIE